MRRRSASVFASLDTVMLIAEGLNSSAAYIVDQQLFLFRIDECIESIKGV